MAALIQINEELLSIDSELTYSDTESEKQPPIGQQQQQQQQPPTLVPEQNNFIKEAEDRPPQTPRPGSKIRLFNTMNNLKMSTKNINQVLPIVYPKDFQVIWKNVSFTVRTFERFKKGTKQILTNLSGSISSGQVTAIMGPSGAGKSTFLEALSCRKSRGLTGEVKVKDIGEVRIAFVPQDNYLMEKLTVYETLYYACKLNYLDTPQENGNYADSVNKLIEMFGLENIRNTTVNRCSGGQQKRISISLELFSNPNMLVLDEPTTGLDSASCSLVVKLLKELVSNPQTPMAVIATIHQPSWNVFCEFDHVYILTRNGQNLYGGSPTKLLPMLSKLNIACDKYNSPSDYIIEIAAEDYGRKPVDRIQAQYDTDIIGAEEFHQMRPLNEARVIRKTPLMKCLTILLQRGLVIYKRNLSIIYIRIVAITLLTMWLAVMFGQEIGKVSGCPMRKLELYNVPLSKLSTLFEESLLLVTQNSCCLFFGLMVGLISGMTGVVLDFPREMHIFMKEYNNGWYSCLSFYITKSIIDLPMQIIVPSIYLLYIYDYTNQPTQYFREAYLLLITVLVSFVSESIGAACSAIFMRNPTVAAAAAGAIPLPMTLFGGFLVKYSRMPIYMQAMSWLSLLKYAFEGMMITMYGFNRCEYSYGKFLQSVNASAIEKPIWAQYLPYAISTLTEDSSTEDPATVGMDEDEKAIYMLYTTTFNAMNSSSKLTFDNSLILTYYEIDDENQFYYSLGAMIFYFVVLKVSTYYIILAKLKYGT